MTKQEFWQYFEEHMSALEQFISSNVHDYTIYNEISDKLRQYDEHLIPEITMDGQGRFVLVLSCDGDREGMPALEHLAENLKDYPNWKIVKYRQPGPMKFIPLYGRKIMRKDILLSWNRTRDGHYQLTFYLKWHYDRKLYEAGAVLHLDHTIGEYNSMTLVEEIEFKRIGCFEKISGLKILDDLRDEIDALKQPS